MEDLDIDEIKDATSKFFDPSYTYLSELESIRDREDRSILRVCSVILNDFYQKYCSPR
jgi:hypothetical protein